MIVNFQGFNHFTGKLNNQDFGIETPRMLLVLDGCSGAKYSEIGTRLFAQLFERKEEFDSLEKFEDNVKSVFEDIIEFGKKYYPNKEDLENEFIMENLLFTIIACFNTEDKYIVKFFGDGYIFSQNNQGCISYMKLKYGDCPPYLAYKYVKSMEETEFGKNEFKTFEFPKSIFPAVGIATDGISPITKGDIGDIDNFIIGKNEAFVELSIKSNRQKFYDDVTIAVF